MKTRFTSFDIACMVTELQKLIGMRVNNIYDIDNKTYLIKLHKQEKKCILLIESGNRIHTTNFEWHKNVAPSGFSMKMRKHLKNKRLESLEQLGADRIINLKFGTGEAAYHIILELYDRGNIILTDYQMIIMNILRPHTEKDKMKFVVQEKYPENRAKQNKITSLEDLRNVFDKAKEGDSLKRILLPHLDYGPALIEHVLHKRNMENLKIGKNFDTNAVENLENILLAIHDAENILQEGKSKASKGYIIMKQEEKFSLEKSSEKCYLNSYEEFHPFLFIQHSSKLYSEFDSFDAAVDEFFSKLENQRIELRALQQEKEARKKLENIKKDHDNRLLALETNQAVDIQKAELITRNQQLVDNAILVVQTALANQISWSDINELIKDAANKDDVVAQSIKQLKLEMNHITLYLTDPYAEERKNNGCSYSNEIHKDSIPAMIVDIDLALSAFANARRYYDQKRYAAKKQQKTVESQGKALKSAERKAKQTLKEVQVLTDIQRIRKLYWFEKFFWFISSENYLVIAGRDQQQNELIVKRYMNSNDIYVHADIHGASSVIIKNPTGNQIPPKTLNEAGIMAICYSVAWEAKVITNAYWVWGEQVSKTAPTGEYLTTGSFMVRGKKNFLPASNLILGFGFLFRLEDSCIMKHIGEWKIPVTENESIPEENCEIEMKLTCEDEDNDEDKEDNSKDKENDITCSQNVIEINNLEEHKENLESVENFSDAQNLEKQKEISENLKNFPDTQITIGHDHHNKIHVAMESSLKLTDDFQDAIPKSSERRFGMKSTSKNKLETEKRDSEEKEAVVKQSQVKRGQKGRIKKIKEKYRDQDEEERQLRMEILMSAGSGKVSRKVQKAKTSITKSTSQTPKIPKPQNFKSEYQEETFADEDVKAQVEMDMINTLTGQPFTDDELLFAVPVVAPYNTLAGYKFKVKITPGTGKRGKAARVAIDMFLKDHTITSREKDLLRAIKDEQLARNLPGKVKLSAPKLQVLKK